MIIYPESCICLFQADTCAGGDASRGFPAQAMLFCQRAEDVKDAHACTIACAADAIFQASTNDEAYSYTCGTANNKTANNAESRCTGNFVLLDLVVC